MTQERRAGVLLVVIAFVYVAFIGWCVWFVVQRHHRELPRGPPPGESVRGEQRSGRRHAEPTAGGAEGDGARRVWPAARPVAESRERG